MNNSDFNILIGDSDPATLSRIRALLQEDDFGVLTSDDPGEILRISASGRFDLFIFDINIYAQLTPQGFQIETREDSTPIIIMTTDDDFELTVSAIKEGAVDFLEKPVRVKRLLITIRNALMNSSKLKQMRRDQDELASLKELYERIINGIDYGIVVLDQNLKIESINDYIERKRQKEKSNYIGKQCFRYFYDRTSICDECKIKDVFSNGLPVKYNLVNKAVGGLNYYLEVEAFPLFDQKGQVNRVVQLVKDVTERIHLEKELREKKEYLESLVSHAPVGIFSTDAQGFIRTANLTFAQLIGAKEPQDTLGLNVLESDDFKKIGLDVEFRKVLEEGQHLDLPEIRCHTAWNQGTICGLRVVPLRGDKEEINGLISTVADVTEKSQLEESYRKRITELSIFKAIGELLQSTIEPSDIYTIALIGVTAGKGLGFNRAFLLHYDRSSNMLRGEAAIGPSDTIEAGRIWSELDEKDLSLIEIFEKYKEDRHNHDIQINQIVRQLEIPITWEKGFIQEVLFQNHPKNHINLLPDKEQQNNDRVRSMEKIGDGIVDNQGNNPGDK